MPSLSPESLYKQGLAALREEDCNKAAGLFRQAHELDKRRKPRQPEMRYLSYYGLSLARAGLSTQFALQACRMAVRRQADDPVLHLNLGRVYRISGRAAPAMRAFADGLRLAPAHPPLQDALCRLERRRSPVIPALRRANPVNVLLGRARARLRGRVRAGSRAAASA